MMLPPALAKAAKPSTVDAVVSVLGESPAIRRMLSEVDQLVRIYRTIPVTTATADRSFSAQRRLKIIISAYHHHTEALK